MVDRVKPMYAILQTLFVIIFTSSLYFFFPEILIFRLRDFNFVVELDRQWRIFV